MITIFTPSYNRAGELKKLYKSLLEQDYDDFEWLIVDDGSKDNTKEFVDKIKKDKKIIINYVYKKNGGKSSAYNVGLDNAKGEIFLCIDSDDILRKNVLKIISKDFENIKNDAKIGGVMYVQSYIKEKDKIIGTEFCNDYLIDNYYNIYNKYKVRGDKLIILKTEVAKKYYFPIIEGEKFVPEALIFNRISLKYNFMCRNYIAAHKEYLEGGYSNNYFSLVKKNPLGNALYFKELYDLNSSLYNIYGYVLFSIYGRKKFRDIIKEHKSKILVILIYLPVLLISKFR